MLISNGAASSVTGASPFTSRARIARRVGSASAENVALRGSAEELAVAMYYTIRFRNHKVEYNLIHRLVKRTGTEPPSAARRQSGRPVAAQAAGRAPGGTPPTPATPAP